MDEKRYDAEGLLRVSELDRCPYFEQDPSARLCSSEDCYFCRFSDFRKREYMETLGKETNVGVLYSVCHNAKNQRHTASVGK